MKLLDKLKNALFEEEYVEVEEKPKKVKPEKVKKEQPKPEIKREVNFEKEEKPIAKRIVPNVKKESNQINENPSYDNPDSSYITEKEEKKFTMITDEDLGIPPKNNQQTVIPEPVKRRRSDIERKIEEPVQHEKKIPEPKHEEKNLYMSSSKDTYLENYTPHEYGTYEKQKEKEIFKPSPIISPIYGIVKDTEKQVPEYKQEIRLTTAVSHEKMNIDDIRKKAFGDLADDIGNNVGMHVKADHIEEKQRVEDEPQNTLLDLTDDKTPPEVNSITMGDAEEYFEDLGLEYNNDYIDNSKKTRVEKNKEIDSQVGKMIVKDDDNGTSTIIIKEKKEESNENINNETPKEEDKEKNLFDLIDSMYEE